jgi:hypothetical protein
MGKDGHKSVRLMLVDASNEPLYVSATYLLAGLLTLPNPAFVPIGGWQLQLYKAVMEARSLAAASTFFNVQRPFLWPSLVAAPAPALLRKQTRARTTPDHR